MFKILYKNSGIFWICRSRSSLYCFFNFQPALEDDSEFTVLQYADIAIRNPCVQRLFRRISQSPNDLRD